MTLATEASIIQLSNCINLLWGPRKCRELSAEVVAKLCCVCRSLDASVLVLHQLHCALNIFRDAEIRLVC